MKKFESLGEESRKEKIQRQEEEKKAKESGKNNMRAGRGEIIVDESYKTLPSSDFTDIQIVPGGRELTL